jgi:hypothetical protein
MAFECPITTGELLFAITSGKKKALRPDGISHEFYQIFWDKIRPELLEIINKMYMDATILDSQKRGLLICLPKHAPVITIQDFHPLTILNTDFKLLTRIIANRIKPWLPDLLTFDQPCGLTGITIFDALGQYKVWLFSPKLLGRICAYCLSISRECSMPFPMNTCTPYFDHTDTVTGW